MIAIIPQAKSPQPQQLDFFAIFSLPAWLDVEQECALFKGLGGGGGVGENSVFARQISAL